jgi:hypothetical protein
VKDRSKSRVADAADAACEYRRLRINFRSLLPVNPF